MSTYSEPQFATYSFGLLAFTTAFTHQVKPNFRKTGGKVADIHVRVTVTFTQTTTPALVNVGTVASATKYASLNMGAAAAGVSYNIVDGAGGSSANVGLVIFSDINFSRDATTVVQFQVVAPTGGSPAGSGFLDIIMEWF